MNIEVVRRVLLWCTVINYGILLVWFFVFMLAHDWMYQFHGRIEKTESVSLSHCGFVQNS